MINPDPLIKGLADAKKNPDRFCMKHWCFSNETPFFLHEEAVKKAEGDCNSVLCIAGWASCHVPFSEEDSICNAVVSYCCEGDLDSEPASGLYDLFYGNESLFPSAIKVEQITIEMVECAIYQWVVKHSNGLWKMSDRNT